MDRNRKLSNAKVEIRIDTFYDFINLIKKANEEKRLL